MLDVYNEYVERRNSIDGRTYRRILPIPMRAFYTMARLPVDDADKFCSWLLTDLNTRTRLLW